jgi:uncharacterized membrane protein YkvA (DUF1232 family)
MEKPDASRWWRGGIKNRNTMSTPLRAQLRQVSRFFKRELAFYRLVARHECTPKLARVLLGLAIGYALLPFDLIPDFIPVIGHLDDAVIVPGLVLLALRLVPREVIEECRMQVAVRELQHSESP